MTNAANPRAVKARNRRERREAERFAADVAWIMNDARGRRFVMWLLRNAGIHETSFRGSALDMAFREGHRNLGLMIQSSVLAAAPDAYLKALEEGKTQQKRESDQELAETETPEKEDADG